jgi:arsenate reductase
MSVKKKVLFLCTGNSARSQMAEGLLRHLAGERFDIESAGTRESFVREQAIEVMSELGIDISSHRSKSLDEFLDKPFDIVITVCDNANQSCPTFPGRVERFHWSFDDPAEATGTEAEVLHTFRRVRDEIRSRIIELLERNPGTPKIPFI